MDIILQTDETNDTCYLAFSKAALEKGSVEKSLRVTDDITLDFDSEGQLVGLDVINASNVLSDHFWNVRLDELIGVKEAAALANVRKPNFVRDYANSPDFPEPVCELATGRVWLQSQVEDYLSSRRTEKPPNPNETLERVPEKTVSALKHLEKEDELFLRHNAVIYLGQLLGSHAATPPTIDEIVAKSIKEDVDAVTLAEQGTVEDYVVAAEKLYSKYSKALRSLVTRLAGPEVSQHIVKETFVAVLKAVQEGQASLTEHTFTAWLLTIAADVFSKRGLDGNLLVPNLTLDPLEGIINAKLLQDALDEHEQRASALHSEEFMVSYLSSFTDEEFVPIWQKSWHKTGAEDVRRVLQTRWADIRQEIGTSRLDSGTER